VDLISYSKETSETEVFYFKLQLKMKLSEEFQMTRTYKSKKFPNSFSGADVVLWLLRNQVVTNKEDGTFFFFFFFF
jgi:hypothetical protein